MAISQEGKIELVARAVRKQDRHALRRQGFAAFLYNQRQQLRQLDPGSEGAPQVIQQSETDAVPFVGHASCLAVFARQCDRRFMKAQPELKLRAVPSLFVSARDSGW